MTQGGTRTQKHPIINMVTVQLQWVSGPYRSARSDPQPLPESSRRVREMGKRWPTSRPTALISLPIPAHWPLFNPLSPPLSLSLLILLSPGISLPSSSVSLSFFLPSSSVSLSLPSSSVCLSLSVFPLSLPSLSLSLPLPLSLCGYLA